MFFEVYFLQSSLRPTWASNSRPRDRESHAPPTEPAGRPMGDVFEAERDDDDDDDGDDDDVEGLNRSRSFEDVRERIHNTEQLNRCGGSSTS